MEIKKEPSAVWTEYQDGLSFNQKMDLEATVRINNNFYNDRQWGGINAPNLDKPCLNLIKPAVNYYVSQLVSDDIGVNIEIQRDMNTSDQLQGGEFTLTPEEYITNIMQDAITSVLENTEAAYKHRLLLKKLALDGDMALYHWFDPDVDTGQEWKGAIKTEIINNTDIFFGNPATAEVERQPYIIIRQRRLLSEVQEEAQANGENPEDIIADNESVVEQEDTAKHYVTVLTKFYKQEGADGKKTVHFLKCTESTYIKRETDLGYSLYPISYSCWEQERNNYHGVSPVTGKINNQIIINKLYALASLDRQNFSFPKVIYDQTKLPNGWSSRPGEAVAVTGTPKEAVFTDFRAADMSAQVLQLISDLDERTKASMGIYDAALGNATPDNTSAILAVQQAAATPLDLQRLDFHRFVESCVRIWLDMMSEDYGIRNVRIDQKLDDGSKVAVVTEFDFTELKKYNWRLKVDIGAAAYWSELLQVQMMDNLLQAGILPDNETYLECLPDGYLKNKSKILERVREVKKQQEQGMQTAQQSAGGSNANVAGAGGGSPAELYEMLGNKLSGN
jgi:hypothetical protein